MKCEHGTQAMENAEIVGDSYEEYVDVQYTPRCENCNKVLPKEQLRYIYEGLK